MSVNVCLLVFFSVLCTLCAFLVYLVYYLRGNENDAKISLTWVNCRITLLELVKLANVISLEYDIGGQYEMAKDYMHRLIEREVEAVDKLRAEKMKRTIDTLTEKEKFSPNGFWKLKKSIAKNQSSPKLNSILKNGVEITGKELIKEEICKEFKHRLRNRKPAEEWEDYVQTSNDMVQTLMEKMTDNRPAFTVQKFW